MTAEKSPASVKHFSLINAGLFFYGMGGTLHFQKLLNAENTPYVVHFTVIRFLMNYPTNLNYSVDSKEKMYTKEEAQIGIACVQYW